METCPSMISCSSTYVPVHLHRPQPLPAAVEPVPRGLIIDHLLPQPTQFSSFPPPEELGAGYSRTQCDLACMSWIIQKLTATPSLDLEFVDLELYELLHSCPLYWRDSVRREEGIYSTIFKEVEAFSVTWQHITQMFELDKQNHMNKAS